MKQVFIGGTGRSGTTILSRWLGSHRSLVRIPCETRFIVDSGGLIDLHDDLTRSYSHDRARITTRRFFDLMENDMTSPWSAPYVGFDFERLFSSNYRKSLEEFRDCLVLGCYSGSDFHSPSRLSRTLDSTLRRAMRSRPVRRIRKLFGGKSRSDLPIEEILVCRKFDSSELAERMGAFVGRLFGEFARNNGADGWCEDTPANVLHIPFLRQLLPESKHLHVVRNPYGVAYSYTQQTWAPSNFELAVQLMRQLYTQSIEVTRQALHEDGNSLLTVRLEDLSHEHCRNRICEFLEIDREQFDSSITIRRIDPEEDKAKLSAAQIDYVDKNLSFVLAHFGYQASGSLGTPA